MSKAESASEAKKPGRPRSERARRAILAAAKSILEEVGPNRLTIEAVARRAGVGKPTIYRHWANAQELAMAALVDATPEEGAAAEIAGIEGLQTLMAQVIDRLNSRRGRQMALMLASAEPEGELFKAFANRVVLDGRKKGLALLQAEQRAGRLRPDADLELILDMLFGAVMLRLLLRHQELETSLSAEALRLLIDGATA